MYPETFRTDRIAPPRRLTFWNEVAAETFGDITVDSLQGEFCAELRRIRLGGLTLASVSSTAARVSGTRAARAANGWFLLLNERGVSRLSQRDREVSLQAGELTALRADEMYRIEFSRPNKTIVMHLPDDTRRIDLERHVARKQDARNAAVFIELMRRLESVDPWNGAALPSFEQLAMDVATLCWPARAQRSDRQSMLAWQQRVHEYVERNLADPTLSAISIGRRFGVTARFVHMVFASTGTTAAAHILEQRLTAAAARLRSNRAARVSDVALDVGFSDLSHFCRAFRRRFGASAREYRAL